MKTRYTYILSRYDSYDTFTRTWTSVRDVGSSFNGTVLSSEVFLHAVAEIFTVISAAYEKAGSPTLYATAVEDWLGACPFLCMHPVRSSEELSRVVSDVLCERYWVLLESDAFYIHFGTDMTVYFGCDVPVPDLDRFAARYGLFLEEGESPYATSGKKKNKGLLTL